MDIRERIGTKTFDIDLALGFWPERPPSHRSGIGGVKGHNME